MSDSDGCPQRDDRHHRRSRSRFPCLPGRGGGDPRGARVAVAGGGGSAGRAAGWTAPGGLR